MVGKHLLTAAVSVVHSAAAREVVHEHHQQKAQYQCPADDRSIRVVLVLVAVIHVHRVTLVTRVGRIRAGRIAVLNPPPHADRCGFPSLPGGGRAHGG